MFRTEVTWAAPAALCVILVAAYVTGMYPQIDIFDLSTCKVISIHDTEFEICDI